MTKAFHWLCPVPSLRKAPCSPLQWVLSFTNIGYYCSSKCCPVSPPNLQQPSPKVMRRCRRMRWTWPAWRWAWSSAPLQLSYWSWAAGLWWRSFTGRGDSLTPSTDPGAAPLLLLFIARIENHAICAFFFILSVIKSQKINRESFITFSLYCAAVI